MNTIVFKGGPLDQRKLPVGSQLPIGKPFYVPAGFGPPFEYIATEDYESGCQVVEFSEKPDPIQMLREQFEKIDRESELRRKKLDARHNLVTIVILGGFLFYIAVIVTIAIIKAIQ